MKISHIALKIALILSTATSHAQQSEQMQWADSLDMSINVFSDRLAITNVTFQRVPVLVEAFTNKLASQSSGIDFAAFTLKRVDSDKASVFTFSPTNGIPSLAIVIGISQHQEDTLKTMLESVFISSMPPDTIAKRFARLPSEPDELVLLETKATIIGNDRREKKVLYWLAGNVFAITHAESGLEMTFSLSNQIRSMIGTISENR